MGSVRAMSDESATPPSGQDVPASSPRPAVIPLARSGTDFEIRDVPADDYNQYAAVAMRQFHAQRFSTAQEDQDRRAARYAHQRVTAAYAGTTIVGTFRSWDGPLAVPGAVLNADFVSTVTVSPTHRRRGVLTQLMNQDLRQAKDSGIALAYLIASSAQIYGRYGYGVCTEHCTWKLDADPALFREVPGAAAHTVEIGQDADLREVAPVVYDAAYPLQPGAMFREPAWWDYTLGPDGPADEEKDAMRNTVVVRDPSGAPVAYARYKVKEASEQRIDLSELEVHDLAAATDAGYARIWQSLASTDLVRTVRAGDRSPDEPLPWLLTDRRAARQSELADFTWARILDVPAALSGRRYRVPGSCVIEVVDPSGLAGGTFVLEAAADGTGTAEPTTAAPEVTIDVQALGSVYLGQLPLGPLRAAGRAVEHVDGAGDRLSDMVTYPAAGWNTHTWF